MNMKDKETNGDNITCLQFREGYDNPSTISEPQSYHIEKCDDCTQWKQEADALSEIARVTPQFDVSENLTQKILSNIKELDLEQRTRFNNVASIILFAAFAWFLLFMDSLESVWGLVSWIIGFGVLLGLKFLVSDSTTSEDLKSIS